MHSTAQCYFGTHFFVASSHLSPALQSTGPVGAGVDWASTDIEKLAMNPLTRAALINARMTEYSIKVAVS